MQTVPAVALPAPRVTPYRVVRIALSLTPLVAVHLALGAIPFVPVTLWALVLMAVVVRTIGVGIPIGFHRYFSHRSFKTSRVFQFLLAAAGCVALQKGPLWWTVYHREHHRHSDREGDPHSPVVDGFWYSHFGWLFAKDMMTPDHRTVRDLTKYPELVWLDRLWLVPGLLVLAGCYAAAGWSGVVYGFCLSVVLTFQVTFAVNSVGHTFGPRRFDTADQSRNNWVLGFLAMGDGWHNNHHRAPSSARHGFAWYELDMSYMTIRLFRRLGLVWDVKQPPPGLMPGTTPPAAPVPADPVPAG